MSGAGAVSLIPALLAAGARRPDRAAFRFEDGRPGAPAVSHGDLAGRISFARRTLESEGVGRGDRVTIALDVGPEAVFGFLGAVSAGAVPVFAPPWSSGLGGGDDRRSLLLRDCRRVDSRFLIVPRALAASVKSAEARVVAGESVSGVDPDPAPPAAAEGDDLCHLQWTSGSTGRPRAVRVTHANVLANARSVRRRCGIDFDDVMVSWAPLHHDMGLQGGMLHGPLSGGETCLVSPRLFLRRPVTWLEILSARRATLTLGPSFSYALARRSLDDVRHGPLCLESVRMIFNGAEPIDADAVREFLDAAGRYGLDPRSMAPAFGLGEATLAVTVTPPGEGMRCHARAGLPPVVSCGTALDGTELRIVDDDGRPVGEGETGEVVVGGDSVCPGYEGEVDDGVFRGGRVHTGDLGFLLSGRLHVVGRMKDVLIIRGVKVAPADVERAAEREPAVLPGRAVAFSVPDPGHGTARAVLLVRVTSPREDRTAVGRRIVARVLEATGLAVDLRFVPSSEIPRTTSGKLRRAEARRRFLEGSRG